MNRKIKKVAVLGSGIMGSRIACHFANAGLEVKVAQELISEASLDTLNLKTMALPVIESLIPTFMGDMTKPFMHMHAKMHSGGKQRLAKRLLLANLAKT